MDPKRFTRRLVALGAAMFLCALVFVITLFDAQIVNGDDYLAQSIRTNAKSETVKASRGVITDRNGKVLVSNRAVYTLNFDSSLVSSDELNDALLRVIDLMNAQGVEIKDTLPLARTSPYAYDTANGSAKTLVKYLVSLKWINEKNVGDDGLPTTLTGSALYLKLRSEYGIDETLPNSTVRTLIGLRYSLASAKMNGSTTFEFASDVDVSLISLIKDGNYAGVQVDTSSVRVYETDYAAHVLGYTGSIQDWDDYKDKDGYTLASTVGISGVENAFEDYLHGSDGKRLVTLNESGKITGELYSVEPKPGSTVALTIDIDFQAQVEEALKNTVSSMTKSDGIDRGAAVAVVPGRHGRRAGARLVSDLFPLDVPSGPCRALHRPLAADVESRHAGKIRPRLDLEAADGHRRARIRRDDRARKDLRLRQVDVPRLLRELHLLLEAQRPRLAQRPRRDHEFLQLFHRRNGATAWAWTRCASIMRNSASAPRPALRSATPRAASPRRTRARTLPRGRRSVRRIRNTPPSSSQITSRRSAAGVTATPRTF